MEAREAAAEGGLAAAGTAHDGQAFSAVQGQVRKAQDGGTASVHGGHGCVDGTVAAYLVDGTAPAAEVRCPGPGLPAPE
ncbi:alpha/beta hydrolase [Streptomyces massasporeus]|uniref:alpha/beta hydrolase n=1 Tax=Streptomyces massasporeus TaxID=67324 RepID=UPI003F4B8BCA